MKDVLDWLYSEKRTRRNLWQIYFPRFLDNCGVTFILSISFHQISSFYNTIEVKTGDFLLEFVQSLFLNTVNRTNRTCSNSCLCTSWGSRISSHLQTACRRWWEIKGWSGTVKKPCDTVGNGKYGLSVNVKNVSFFSDYGIVVSPNVLCDSVHKNDVDNNLPIISL